MESLINKFKPKIYIDNNEKSKLINPNIYLETNKIKYDNTILTNIVNKDNKIYLYYLLFIHNVHKSVILNINCENYDYKYPIFEKDSTNCHLYFNHSNVYFKDKILPISNSSYIYSFNDEDFNNKFRLYKINIMSFVIEIDKNENINGVCLIPNIIQDIDNNFISNLEPYWIKDKNMFDTNSLSFYISFYSLNPYLIKDNNINDYIGSISLIGDFFNKFNKLNYNITTLNRYSIETYSMNNSFMNIPKIFYTNLNKFEILDKYHLKWFWYKKYNIFARIYKYYSKQKF